MTTIPQGTHGGLATFNVQHGFIEALVRGMRCSFLADADYHHITQCETLEDVKLNLSETDYADAVADMANLNPSDLQSAAIEKLVAEFKYLRSQATEPLSTFLDFITYEYMIENIMLLLKGALSGRDINELLAQCHPLGMFKDSTMRSIPTFEPNAKGFADLYQTVLVDTPVGPYFAMFLQESSNSMGGEVRNVIEEVEIEIIKSSLIKYWIEDFTQYVMKLGGETAEVMGDLLKVRADTNAINITLNSSEPLLMSLLCVLLTVKGCIQLLVTFIQLELQCFLMFLVRRSLDVYWISFQNMLVSGMYMQPILINQLMMLSMSVMFRLSSLLLRARCTSVAFMHMLS
jgi:V-type H+-transporting ATPase subunit d